MLALSLPLFASKMEMGVIFASSSVFKLALAASVLKCWILESTEGELREEDRAVGWMVVELEVWQGFGRLRTSVDRQESSLGLGKLGASKRA